MIIAFDPEAFEDFQAWAIEDKKVFTRIGSLIKDIMRSPLSGIGKPEPLKHNLSGFWSRRITDEHRLVYKVEKDTVYILSCKYHY
jgi:toxin YoeB